MNQTRAKARTFTAFVCNCIIINRYNDYAGLENMSLTEIMPTTETGKQTRWFVMRDLKRPNAKQPAYKFLREEGFEVFVPTKSQIITRNGKKVVEEIPVIRDLLFVHTEKERLDPIVARTETLQYRFMRNCGRAPMTVPDDEMERFIIAVSSSNDTKYYLPEEITSQMYGRKIRIVGGPLDGYEGNLITTRGSKVKRLMIKLQDFFAAGVEVNPEYIQLI